MFNLHRVFQLWFPVRVRSPAGYPGAITAPLRIDTPTIHGKHLAVEAIPPLSDSTIVIKFRAAGILPVPLRRIPGGIAGPGLVAEVIVSKHDPTEHVAGGCSFLA
jgi:hypothetical protein